MALQSRGANSVQQELYNNHMISFLFTFAYDNIYSAITTYYFFDKRLTGARATTTTKMTIIWTITMWHTNTAITLVSMLARHMRPDIPTATPTDKTLWLCQTTTTTITATASGSTTVITKGKYFTPANPSPSCTARSIHAKGLAAQQLHRSAWGGGVVITP